MLNLSSGELCRYIGGEFLFKHHDKKILNVNIYSTFANEDSAFFAIDSRKHSNLDGALGFTCNEDSVFGLGGIQDGHDEINIAIRNGVNTIVVDNRAVAKSYDNINYILVEDTVEALAKLARYIIESYNIMVIAITGSLGKTTTTNGIFQLINSNSKYNAKKIHRVRTTYLGLIIDIIQKLQNKDILVLECQSDGLGQIDKFCSIAKPNIAIITAIRDSHLKKFGSKENILIEKLSVYRNLTEDGRLIINIDDNTLADWYSKNPDSRIITIGTREDCDYRADNITTYGDYKLCKFCMISKNHQNDLQEISLNMAGNHSIYCAISAIAIADILGFTVNEIRHALKELEAVVGRFQGFIGLKDCFVVVDSYNGNFDAICSGIIYMDSLSQRNKILILGSLLELSYETESIHRELGRFIAENSRSDTIILLGETTLYVYDELKKCNRFSNMRVIHVFTYEDIIELIPTLNITQDTAVYIKGSGAMRMELIAPHFLAKKAFGLNLQ